MYQKVCSTSFFLDGITDGTSLLMVLASVCYHVVLDWIGLIHRLSQPPYRQLCSVRLLIQVLPPPDSGNKPFIARIASPSAFGNYTSTIRLNDCPVCMTCQTFPGPLLLLFTNNYSSTLSVFKYCGWD